MRFQDRLRPGACVKLMTDGILLAETQSDPLLRAYDTIIIDEAHERSLNIDFLLGYLKQLLPRRPDLQGRRHLGDDRRRALRAALRTARRAGAGDRGVGPAVSGRDALAAVRRRRRRRTTLGRRDLRRRSTSSGRGPVARAGRATCWCSCPASARSARRRRAACASTTRRGVEILPLFARLSAAASRSACSRRTAARRIVLATNVAETSLTVPGIRYVIDAGTGARQALQLSQQGRAAADRADQRRRRRNQRAGRCGRVADGICIRLYDEDDFAARPRFTDPEILRSSLAGVILRMKALDLGEVEEFPFLEPPPRARDRRRLPAAAASWARSTTQQRADADRPRARARCRSIRASAA